MASRWRRLSWISRAALSASFVHLAGCSILPVYISGNHATSPDSSGPPTKASSSLSSTDIHDGVFVGVSISGGGSRAANFGAATLLELEQLGLLPHVAAVSSISGGSLAAAYFSLHANNPKRWNSETIKRQFATDFERAAIIRLLLPQNAVRLGLTYYSRNDVMASVFDSKLFDGRRFRDLAPNSPRLLINSSYLAHHGQLFSFTDENFTRLGSQIADYRVSQAVIASGAFPGAFRNVTLRNFTAEKAQTEDERVEELQHHIRNVFLDSHGYSGDQRRQLTKMALHRRAHGSPRYIHLFDGGVVENLGITPLFEILRDHAEGGKAPEIADCLMIAVDAYPYRREPGGLGSDFAKHLRVGETGIGMLFDTNALAASDLLLRGQRLDVLERLGHRDIRIEGPELNQFGLTGSVPAAHPITRVTVQDFLGNRISEDNPAASLQCTVWTISFDRLQYLASGTLGSGLRVPDLLRPRPMISDEQLEALHAVATSVRTRYKLTSPLPLPARYLQQALFQAAHTLVNDDPESLTEICSWFRERNVNLKGCQRIN